MYRFIRYASITIFIINLFITVTLALMMSTFHAMELALERGPGVFTTTEVNLFYISIFIGFVSVVAYIFSVIAEKLKSQSSVVDGMMDLHLQHVRDARDLTQCVHQLVKKQVKDKEEAQKRRSHLASCLRGVVHALKFPNYTVNYELHKTSTGIYSADFQGRPVEIHTTETMTAEEILLMGHDGIHILGLEEGETYEYCTVDGTRQGTYTRLR